jgi:putative PIG3 family NAD(P)H quinone oxidoreductase
MRAIVVSEPGPPDVLQIGQVSDPEPEADEVVIRVSGAGVNRADLQQRIGVYPPPEGASPTIGLECSGVIESVGAAVTGWRGGDPAVALLAGGGYAEQVAVPQGQVVSPPEGLDLVSAGGLMETAATVVSNLERGQLSAGETFLVHGGAGGIGSFAIQYAKLMGAAVIATAGTQPKLDHCRSLGADLAVSYRGDWPEAVADFTDQRGVDVILDNMGAKYLDPNTAALAADGRLMIIGMQGGRKATLDIGRMLGKRAAVFATGLRGRPVDQKAAICQRVAQTVWPMYADGRMRPAPETRYPLADAARAHAQLEGGDNVGKIVLVP